MVRDCLTGEWFRMFPKLCATPHRTSLGVPSRVGCSTPEQLCTVFVGISIFSHGAKWRGTEGAEYVNDSFKYAWDAAQPVRHSRTWFTSALQIIIIIKSHAPRSSRLGMKRKAAREPRASLRPQAVINHRIITIIIVTEVCRT